VIGEIVIGRTRIPFDGTGTFTHGSVDHDHALGDWAGWLSLPG
jgi:hypothetical protein